MTDIVALQLYTVRDETAKDFKGTIRKVAEIGYAGVEFAGYGDIPAAEMAALLQETGLKAVGSHVGLGAFEADFDGQVAYLKAIDCNLAIIPWLPKEQLQSAEGFQALVSKFNELGQRLHEQGIHFAYHNHDFEFEKVDGDYILDRLAAATDPSYVKFELDTFWVAFAGADAVDFLHRHSGRIASIHLKDMDASRKFTEVGDGTLDIAGYKEAAQEAGAHVFVVENDQPQIASLESARRSFENLHRSLT